jgi:hypothetical protein
MVPLPVLLQMVNGTINEVPTTNASIPSGTWVWLVVTGSIVGNPTDFHASIFF